MKLPNNCDGCGQHLSVTAPVYPHAMGTLCKTCIRFAMDLDAEVARLRRYAEQLADIEASWLPAKGRLAN